MNIVLRNISIVVGILLDEFVQWSNQAATRYKNQSFKFVLMLFCQKYTYKYLKYRDVRS